MQHFIKNSSMFLFMLFAYFCVSIWKLSIKNISHSIMHEDEEIYNKKITFKNKSKIIIIRHQANKHIFIFLNNF